jgi:hypothetical protein
MKSICLNSLNQPVDGGRAKTRAEWEKYAAKKRTEQDKKLGFHPVVGLFENDNGSYYRINWGAQPKEIRIDMLGRRIT